MRPLPIRRFLGMRQEPLLARRLIRHQVARPFVTEFVRQLGRIKVQACFRYFDQLSFELPDASLRYS